MHIGTALQKYTYFVPKLQCHKGRPMMPLVLLVLPLAFPLTLPLTPLPDPQLEENTPE
jgi:hypothetical protein